MTQSVIARFVTARALNTFGRAVISATVGWELFARTGDPLVFAYVGAVQVLPVLLLFTWSGALADRSDRRKLAGFAATGTGLIGLGLGVASWLHAPVPTYLVLLLALGCMTSVHAPSASTVFPLIVPREDLERGNRAVSSFSELALITGPTLAGLALAVVHASFVYAVVALTGLATGILYRTLPVPRVIASTGGAAARRDWRTGLRFIFRSPLLLPALTLDMFAVLFAGVTALMPAIATDILHTGPIGYGFLRAAQSFGAVLSAVVTGRIRPWVRPGRVLLVVVALFAVATIGIGLSRSLPLTVALLVACGALDNVSVVIRLTLEQIVVPDAIRGRVGAVNFVFIGMSNELGGAESGLAAHLFGAPGSIIGGGVLALVVVGIVALKFRALVTMPPLAELQPHPEPD